MTTHTVHFTVEGEFITETARRLWNVEDEHERAMNILRCMQGITDAQCLDILEGRSKLVGDSDKGIQLKPDQTKGKSVTDVIRKLKEERDEARDERADLTQMAIGDTVGMGSPTGLRRVPRRKTEIRGIPRGHVMKDGYEFDDVLAENPKPGVKPQRVWQQVENLNAMSRDDKEDKEDEEEPPRPPPPEPQSSITGDTGWLDPDGKFYPCGYAQHAQTAWKLGLTDNPQAHGIELVGWIRLSTSGSEQHFFGESGLFTPVQHQLVRAYCQKKKIEEPYWLQEEKS